MIKNKLNIFTIILPASSNQILKKINNNAKGVIFVVDKKNKLIGSISDGDIRRAILKKKLTKNISIKSSIVNRRIISLKSNSNIENIFKSFSNKKKLVKCIPLVNNLNEIVDISFADRIKPYPIAEPQIGNSEITNVLRALKSGWISSRGYFISQFEKSFSTYLGGGYAVAVSNGTSALQAGIMALGLGKGDEILVPNFTFAASINSIINAGCKPILVDVDRDTWTIDVNQIENKITKRTKAIMPVHIYGQPCRIDEIKKISQKKKLFVIEDCAEAIGAIYKKRLVGLDFDCSCFSFFANKTITTGEGGMAVFKNKKHEVQARLIINHGMSLDRKYYHEIVGNNFRMTNIQAAIGLAQIKKIKKFISNRKKIATQYNKLIKSIKNVEFLPSNKWSQNSYWLYTLLLKNTSKQKIDLLINNLINRGIECRPGFGSLNQMKPYRKYANGNYKISNLLSSQTISLPSTNLSKMDIEYVVEIFKQELSKIIS
jgi:perosamine synthetase